MWCERCGKELAENARFCTGCGTPVIQNAERASGQEQVPDTTPMPTPEKAKVPKSKKSMSKGKKITLVVLLGVMVLAIAAAALFANWHISERNKEAALQIAADYAKNGDYENAIHTVISTRNYEKDVRLNTAYQNYCAEYEAQILSVVDDLITVENYYAAQKTAIEAIGILPKSEKLRDAYAKCQWDQVLLENADFSVVRKDLDCYDSYTVRVGILDSNGDWICPLSSSCIFALAINDTGNLHSYNGNRIKIDSGNFAYLGEGVMSLLWGWTSIPRREKAIPLGATIVFQATVWSAISIILIQKNPITFQQQTYRLAKTDICFDTTPIDTTVALAELAKTVR